MSSLFQTNKPKSAGKIMMPSGQSLESVVLETLAQVADMVGATLGPGGRQVLIERPEMNMKPIITKDGVTVIKHLGFQESTKQLILEAVRDAAIRTASEAGDGTTTATILSNSIAAETAKFVKANSRISPQKVVREMQALVPFIVERINQYKIDLDAADIDEVLLKVATLSANGDVELAKITIEAFDLVGEEGNITIIEQEGPSSYGLERITGYTVDRGYEESLRNFANGFINDQSGTMVQLEHPLFVLYDGTINDIQQIMDPLGRMASFFDQTAREHRGVVLVAHGFSDSVLGDLHLNWTHPKSGAKICPLLTPQSAILNWRTQFLYDLQAYTGSTVYNPVDRPLSDMKPEEVASKNKVTYFESGRFRSSVIAKEDEFAIELRVEELKAQRMRPESQYEVHDLDVRIGKLTSGIARLKISAPSRGETREKRDRAEDAWMAIRGTIKHGAIPGGGYGLVRVAADLLVKGEKETSDAKKAALGILADALLRPVRVLYSNYGYNEEEIAKQISQLLVRDNETFDISEQKWVEKFQILDSVPAVVEAIRNSISIASLLGTVGGLVAFKRDYESDKDEERQARNFERAIGDR